MKGGITFKSEKMSRNKRQLFGEPSNKKQQPQKGEPIMKKRNKSRIVWY
jgi:hypothetical protein